MVDVGIITVNFRSAEQIRVMLHSLYHDLDGTTLSFQPVIVDNSDDARLRDILAQEFNLAKPTLQYINAGANLGFGRGNNLGCRAVDARYYFLANPDLEFLPDQPRTVERLYAFLEARPEVGIVAPRLQRPDGSTQPSCMRFPLFLDPPLHRLELHKRWRWARGRVERMHMHGVDHASTRPIDWATGAALFVRGSSFRDVGFFDERYFMYVEDCDLCRTFWSRGWPVYYTGDIVVRHGHERASAKIPGLKSLVVNPLTRVHLRSLVRYTWKWRNDR